MRILFYTMNWYPFEGSMQHIYAAVLKYLKKRGHEITILTSIPYFMNGREERWYQYRGKFFLTEYWEGIKVTRTFVLSPYFLRRFKKSIRVINFISFILNSLIAGLFVRRHDIILTVSHPPLFIGLNSYIISRIKKCHYIYCLQDIFPDILAGLKIIQNRCLLKFLKKIELLVYKTSRKICVLSSHMRDNLLSKGVAPEKIEVIPHFADLNKIVPLSKQNSLAIEYGLDSKFTALLPGSISYGYEIDTIYDSAKLLLNNKNIRFVFIDRGEFREDLKQKVASYQLENVQFLPFQPDNRFSEVLASADVCLVPHGNVLAPYSVPSKLYNIMASARPVIAIADENSELARVIRVAECGITIPSGSPILLVEEIKNLSTDRGRCKTMGKNGREFIERNLDPDTICDRYEKVISNTTTN